MSEVSFQASLSRGGHKIDCWSAKISDWITTIFWLSSFFYIKGQIGTFDKAVTDVVKMEEALKLKAPKEVRNK